MTDEIDLFTKSITHSDVNGEQITLEVEEYAAIKEESGEDEIIAFQESVIEVFGKWKSNQSQ